MFEKLKKKIYVPKPRELGFMYIIDILLFSQWLDSPLGA
jgi:hypothetical protein